MPEHITQVSDSIQQELAGFASRAMAYIIDLAIMTCMLVMLFFALGYDFIHGLPSNLESIIGGAIAAIILLFLLPPCLYLAYFSLLHSWSGQTIGKLCMGIRVVTFDGSYLGIGQAILRCLATFISSVPLGAGFLWAALDRRKRTWHDLIAGTEVIFSSNLP